MAALDLTVASNGRTVVTTTRKIGTDLVKAEVLVDLSAATGTVTTTSTDTVKIMIIPAGAHVISVGAVVLAADSGGATFSVQDSAGSSNWIPVSGIVCATKGNYVISRPSTTDLAASGGKVYVADNYLQLLSAVAVTTTAKLVVWAIYSSIENVEKSY